MRLSKFIFLLFSFLSFNAFAENKVENKIPFIDSSSEDGTDLPVKSVAREGVNLGLRVGNQYWTNPVTQKITKLPLMVHSYEPIAKDIIGYFIRSDTDASTLMKVQQLKTKKVLSDYVANFVAEIKKNEMCHSVTKAESKEVNKIKVLKFSCNRNNREDFLIYVWGIDKNRFLSVFASYDHLSPRSLEYAESFATSLVQ